MFDELISAVTDTAAFSESLHSYLLSLIHI